MRLRILLIDEASKAINDNALKGSDLMTEAATE